MKIPHIKFELKTEARIGNIYRVDRPDADNDVN